MKDEFLAILSHELRSPLNAILGWAQLLHSHKLDEKKVAKAIETIERNARAQKQLIEDLLDISRMIRGKLRLEIRTCHLVTLIEAAIDTVRLAAEAKGIDLKFSVLDCGSSKHSELQSDISEQKFLVSGDAERLQQVMWNLLSNGIKFTPPGGRVDIQLQEVEQQSKQLDDEKSYPSFAKITVSDTGIGINSEFLPYVFDRFCQADSSITRAYGGLGLGLAIVRHLVELHGGNVYVESLGEGKGATFTVILPLVNKKEEHQERQIQQVTQKPSPIRFSLSSRPPSSLLKGVKVLVVDDEADTREYVSATLKQYQAEVMVAESAYQALAMIKKWKPNVLVSDIGMPEEDGYSLIRKVRKREALKERHLKVSQRKRVRSQIINSVNHRKLFTASLTPQGNTLSNPTQKRYLPAAALTAYARTEDQMRAIKEGFQMHLPKPIEPLELTLVVANLAGRI
jgi:CheY-like chemotaxis protein/two-component sensor histidine kinase